jgi:uncharacterized protein (DUF2345 family)
MATSQNRPAQKTQTGDTAKKSFTSVSQGNDHGSISFGQVSADGAVTSNILLQASDGRHSIALDKDGPRKGATQITAPGRISIQSGEDKAEAEDTVYIEAKNGNIDIIASNGKIRIQGTDIELIATGEGGSKGNIQLNATENIKFESKKFLVNATVMYKLASAGSAEIVANSCMTIYSSIIRGVTDGVANKNGKCGGQDFQRKNSK